MGFRKRDVEALLKSHGQLIDLISFSAGVYNPATSSSAPTPNPTVVVKGYFYNYSLEEMTNSSIEVGDRKLLLTTTDTSGVTIPEPKMDDKFSAATGDTVTTKNVTKIYSGSDVMAYIVGVGE
tara:strand:+ start:2067 stop:2435 length:369 start_codon:yes stop_codon:yes gene_type:complete